MSKVPKFGAWEGTQGDENFTVYFDKARKTKNDGPKINPNDPEENPEWFYPQGQPQAAPSKTRPVEKPKPKQSRPGPAEDKPQARTDKAPQGRAKVPQFGGWNGGGGGGNGEGTQYTAYFDNARKTKNNVGSEPVMNYDLGESDRASQKTQGKAEVVKDDGLGNKSRKSSGSGSDALAKQGSGPKGTDGLAKQGSGQKTPVHPKAQGRAGGGGRGGRAAAVPTFGAWNNDPSQAEGYTVAFTRAREERHTPLHNNAAPSYNQPPQANNQTQGSCCTIL